MSEEQPVDGEKKPEGTVIQRAASLACGMLFQDGSWILLLFAILIIAIPFRVAMPVDLSATDLRVEFFHGILRLLVLYMIGSRWIGKFRKTGSDAPENRTLPLLLLYGTGFWILRYLPDLVHGMGLPEAFAFLAPALIVPTSFIRYVYFFYFFPILLGQTRFQSIYQETMRFIRTDWLLPFKVMVAPCAIALFLDGCLGIISPENELMAIAVLRIAIWEVYFILSTYLACAIGFVLLPGIEWRQQKLEPYREARFTTISLQAPSLVSKFLEPRNGFKIFFVALLLGLANFAAVSTRPPSANIEVQSVHLSDSQLILRLHLSDPEYQFRSFSPVWLSVGGPEGESVTKLRQPVGIKVNGGEFGSMSEVLGAIGNDEMDLELAFDTTRDAAAMKSLEDLHLWYRSAKLQLLSMKDATVEDAKESDQATLPADEHPTPDGTPEESPEHSPTA